MINIPADICETNRQRPKANKTQNKQMNFYFSTHYYE